MRQSVRYLAVFALGALFATCALEAQVWRYWERQDAEKEYHGTHASVMYSGALQSVTVTGKVATVEFATGEAFDVDNLTATLVHNPSNGQEQYAWELVLNK